MGNLLDGIREALRVSRDFDRIVRAWPELTADETRAADETMREIDAKLAEIAELRRRIEALEARPIAPVIVPSYPWPQPSYPQPGPYNPWSPYYPTVTNGGTSCQAIPSMTV